MLSVGFVWRGSDLYNSPSEKRPGIQSLYAALVPKSKQDTIAFNVYGWCIFVCNSTKVSYDTFLQYKLCFKWRKTIKKSLCEVLQDKIVKSKRLNVKGS